MSQQTGQRRTGGGGDSLSQQAGQRRTGGGGDPFFVLSLLQDALGGSREGVVAPGPVVVDPAPPLANPPPAGGEEPPVAVPPGYPAPVHPGIPRQILIPHPQPPQAVVAAVAPRPPAFVPAPAVVPQPQPQPRTDPTTTTTTTPVQQPAYPITLRAMKQIRNHPLRMKLEWDEVHRARSINDAFQRTAGLDEINDFWCAQYALICKDIAGEVRMENVIERAEALQVFRNQYGIVHSLPEGFRALTRLVALCPNFVLAFLYDPRKGNYTMVRNLANFSAESFSPDDVRDFLVGCYYCFLAERPDFQSIHKGPDMKVECKDMGWSKRHNMMLFKKGAEELISVLPIDICSGKYYNTGVGGAVFNMLLKPIISIIAEPLGGEEWQKHKKIHFVPSSSSLEGGLDSVFLVPDANTAQQRTLNNMLESLRMRFQNETRFSLSEGDDQTNIEIIVPYTDDEIEAVYDARREYTTTR